MSNRPKLQKPRISNREMARDTKTLIGAGVEMCKLIRRATPNAGLQGCERSEHTLQGVVGASDSSAEKS